MKSASSLIALLTFLCTPVSFAERVSGRRATVDLVVHTGPGGRKATCSSRRWRSPSWWKKEESCCRCALQVINKPGGNGAVAAAHLAEKKRRPEYALGLFHTGVLAADPAS